MATRQQTQTTTKAAEKVALSLDEVTHELVRAQTTFKTVVQAEHLPLVWDSELNFARKIVMNDPANKLRFVVPATLANVMENLAHVGLTLNPIKQHCTIIARWNEKQGVLEAHPMFMYRGLVYLATQAGVHDIAVDVVYKADTFKAIRKSEGDFFEHEVNIAVPRDGDNTFQGVYVAARMPKSGERKLEWVPAEDIYKMRDQSDGYRKEDGTLYASAPWVRWFDEQAKKSGLKRATKRWEEAIYDDTVWQRLQRAVALDHAAEGGGRTFEGTSTPVEEPKLTIEQIADIELKARDIYAAEENREKFLLKVCNAYGVEALADVGATKYNEVLERIGVAKAEIEKHRAKTAKRAK